MSDTRVFVVPGWGPEHPKWREFSVRSPKDWPIQMTKKHQARDQSVWHGKQGGKFGRFTNGHGIMKNCRYNLERKNDALREKEALTEQ